MGLEGVSDFLAAHGTLLPIVSPCPSLVYA